MKNDFREEIDARLGDMDWRGREALLLLVQKRRAYQRPRTVAIACVILILLCATASAVTLRYTRQYSILRQAREAISAKYGLTSDMLDMFAADVESGQGEWRVRFRPAAMNGEAMGEYIVERREGEKTEASWSHDGDVVDETGDLGTSVWGAKQLERVIALRRASAKAWSVGSLSQYDEMTLEERAALDEPLKEARDAVSYINIAPEEGDIPPEEAVTRMRQAITEKYGIPDEKLA